MDNLPELPAGATLDSPAASALPPLPDGATLDNAPTAQPAAPAQPTLVRSGIDYAKDIGAGLASGVGTLVRGVGEAGRMVASPIVSGVNALAGSDVLPKPVNAFAAPADALQGVSNSIVSSEDPSNQNGMGHTLVRNFVSAVPAIAGAALTDGAVAAPAVGAALFGAQSGGQALQDESDRINSMPATELAQLPGYQSKITAGMTPDAARAALAQDAGRSAFLPAAGVGAAFGAIPGSKPIEGLIGRLSGEAPTLTRKFLTRTAVDAPIFGGLSVGQEAAQTAGAQSATGETGPLVPNPVSTAASGIAPAVGFAAAGLLGGLLHRRIAPPEIRPPVPALTHEPDFIVNANGRTVYNKGDQTLGQPVPSGGPGMDQPVPVPPRYPNAPTGSLAEAANTIDQNTPLALTHQPDVIVDARGRAVVNKGDRTLGQPFGGTGIDQQAPQGSLTAISDEAGNGQSAGTSPGAGTQPPDADATSVAPAGAGPSLDGGAAASVDPDGANLAQFKTNLDAAASARGLDAGDVSHLQQQLFQPAARDKATGFYTSADLDPTVQRAQDFARDTGQPAVYLEADVGGTNVAAKHLNEAATGLYQHLIDAGGGEGVHVVPVRKGPDEYGFVVTGAQPRDVHEAARAAQSDIADYAQQHGIRSPDFGVHFGLSEIPPDGNVKDVFRAADAQVEARKAGAADYEFGNEAGTAGAVAPGEQPAGAAGATDATTGEGPTGTAGGDQPAGTEPADKFAASGDNAGGPGHPGTDGNGNPVAEPAAAAESGGGAAGSAEPAVAAKPPVVATPVGNVKVDYTHDIPYVGSSGKDGTVYVDKDWNPIIQDGPLKGLNRTPMLVAHEAVEAHAENAGDNYSQSHYDHAEPAEHKVLLDTLGLQPGTPEADKAIEAYEQSYKPDLRQAQAKKNPNIPPDIIQKPYDHPHTQAQRRLLDEVDANVEHPDEQPEPIAAGHGQGTDADSAGAGGLAAGGDSKPLAPGATGAVSHEQPAASPDLPAAQVSPREARIQQSAGENFAQLHNEIGWEQRGGRILREADRADGQKPEVIGRTNWVGKQGPLGESGLWRSRPDKITPQQGAEALRKAQAGESLAPREQRFVDHAQRTARLYAEAEEADREQSAKDRGFPSVESMLEHDSVNLVGEHAEPVAAGTGDEIPFGDTGPVPDYGDEVPFSRSPERPGMSRAAVAGTIHDVVGGWHGDAPRVQVHQSHTDANIPPSIRSARGFGRGIEGAYDPATRTVHLFADALREPQRALQVLAHEVFGHYGLEHVLGKDWGQLVADINRLRENTPAALKPLFDEVARRYPGANAETFASEAMAVMAEKGISNTFTDRAFAAIRRFLRSMGLKVRLNDAELRQMLVAAKRRVEGELHSPQGEAFRQRLAFAQNSPRTLFSDDLDAHLAGRKSGRENLRVGTTSAPLRMIGWADRPIRMTPEAVGKILGGKDGERVQMTRDQLVRAVDQLDHPSAIFKSSTRDGSVVVATDVKDADGERIVLALRPDGGEGRVTVHKVASAYGKDRAAWFDEQAKAGRLLYVDKNKGLAGLQSTARLDSRGEGGKQDLTHRVLTNDDVRKWAAERGVAFSRNVGVGTGDLFGDGAKANEERAKATPPQSGDMFGGATTRDHVDAAVRAKDEAMRGSGAAPTMRQGAGELFAGSRPEQPKFSRTDTAGLTNGELTDRGRMENAAKAWKEKGTDSPFFRRWFGASKVAEADGKPKILYHGTADEFNEFSKDKAGANTGHMTAPLGHYLTESRAEAQRYAEKAANGVPADERVISAYASIKRPMPMTKEHFLAIDSHDQARALRAHLEAEGYDGIRLDLGNGKTQWIAFDSSQIKDVGNRGTFDATNPDIRFSRAPADGVGSNTGAKEPESFLDKLTGRLKPSGAELAARAIKVAAIRQRDLARGVLRSAWAARDRAISTADAGVDSFRKHFDMRPATVRNDPQKSYASVIAYQQGREGDITDPAERKFITTMASMLGDQAQRIRAFGDDKLNLLKQYFPQLWKDPERAEQELYTGQQKRPLAGNTGFRKERVFADMERGIKAGFVPAFDNPVDALMARYQSGERYLQSLKIRSEIDGMGMLRKISTDDRVPRGFARVNDNTFNGHVVPELVARDLNNYLAPGLSQFKAWRGFRWLQNGLLSARLGFSFFHAGFTTVDSAITHLDLAGRYLLDGDVASALGHMAKVPLAPFRAMRELAGKGEGSTLVRQFFGKEAIDDPNTAAIFQALMEGGARGKMDPSDWNNDFGKTLRAWRTDGAKGLAGTPMQSLGAVVEGVMRPITHYLVPAQKMTARVAMMKFELDHIAGKLGQQRGDYAAIVKAMNQDALRKIAGDVVQRVDDRLGQMAYDNLFWNRLVKDISQASIQSVGWNVGTGNVILKGLGDLRKIFKPDMLTVPLDKAGTITDHQLSRVSGRLSYLVALNLGVGSIGAISQYLMTGNGPQELKDYFFPKTGDKNPDGSDARMSFPSYVKDEYGFRMHPIQTIEHKLHPAFSMVAELLNNKDFYGNEVYNPDDPWTKVAEQIGAHLLGGFEPYAFQNQQRVATTGGGLGARVAPFVGITPAPGDVTHSDFENFVNQRYYNDHPSGTKTPEQGAESNAFFQAAAALRRGEQPDTSQFSPRERAALVKYARSNPIQTHFNHLDLPEKLAAYEQATPQERDQYKLRATILHSRWYDYIDRQRDPQTRTELRQRVNSIRSAQ